MKQFNSSDHQPSVAQVLALWDQKLDTKEIASALMGEESKIEILLHKGLQERRRERNPWPTNV